MNTKPKYVASTMLGDPLEWQSSTVLQGDLVDEFWLMIDPLVVGGGKRLFSDGGALRPMRLVDSHVTTTGAILATYAPAE